MTTKLFTGIYREAYQQCVKEGYTPATIPVIAKLRCDGAYCNTYIDTATFSAYNGKGKMKILHGLTKEQYDTWIVWKEHLTLLEYNELKGKEFDVKDYDWNVKDYDQMTKEEVLANPIWNALIPDKELLKEYADMVFSKVPEKNMGIWISTWPDTPQLRPWFLKRIGDGYGANANDGGHLDYADARLVGVKNSTSGANVISHPEICGNCKQCGQIWKSLMKHVKEEH